MIIKTKDTISANNPDEFCPIPENESYLINCNGSIYSLKRKKFIQVFDNSSGNPSISIPINGKVKTVLVHKVLANIFIANPHNYKYAYTKDGDKYNLSLDNIEWYEKQRKGERTIFH